MCNHSVADFFLNLSFILATVNFGKLILLRVYRQIVDRWDSMIDEIGSLQFVSRKFKSIREFLNQSRNVCSFGAAEAIQSQYSHYRAYPIDGRSNILIGI